MTDDKFFKYIIKWTLLDDNIKVILMHTFNMQVSFIINNKYITYKCINIYIILVNNQY